MTIFICLFICSGVTFFCLIFWIILSFYYTIRIDTSSKTIIVKEKKICCCCNKKEIIQISDLQKVIVESDDETNSFYVYFKLINGRSIHGCSNSNGNGEGKRVFERIRNVLPQNIAFEGDLTW